MGYECIIIIIMLHTNGMVYMLMIINFDQGGAWLRLLCSKQLLMSKITVVLVSSMLRT